MTKDSSAKPEPCILEVDGVSYDATNFVKDHPGGATILAYAGRDATDVFYAFHSKQAIRMLQLLPKSTESVQASEQGALLKEFRALRKSFEERGWMDASNAWYVYKTVSTLALGAVGLYLALAWHWAFLGALFMGLCYQQLGWLAHDICHNCWFDNRLVSRWAAYLLGNMLQGFDVFWWSDRHNQHHAVPNVLGGHGGQGDPDIDNLPVVAWDVSDLDRCAKWPVWAKKMLRWQGYYFVLVMPLLRLIWALQSYYFLQVMPTSVNPTHRKYATESKVFLAIFWSWNLVLSFFMPSFLTAVMFFLVSNLLGGAGIAFVVFFNHHSLEKVPANNAVDNFVTIQLYGTRNMEPSPFVDWLWGGLNYQIEHHLFPTCPRHNLSKIRPELMQLFAKHNVPYYTESFLQGLKQMCTHLTEVASHLSTHEKKNQ